jgi:hypothetical protein
MIVNDEEVKIWKEAVLAYFKVPFAWRNWGKPWRTSVRIASNPVKILTRCLQNKVVMLLLDHPAWLEPLSLNNLSYPAILPKIKDLQFGVYEC